MGNKMTDNMIELAKRAIACKHWKWMAGMRQLVSANLAPYRVVSLDWSPPEGDTLMETYANVSMLPDLTDPATLGCLLALVREAWSDQRINTLPTTDGGWAVADGDDDWICTGTTESAALVAALEAAPDTEAKSIKESKC
jgi:hypothetical protein